MRPILDDYRTAPIGERLRAMLALLERVTLDPDEIGPEDVRVAIDAGVSREAIRGAYDVAFLFNVYDRLADTLGWELPADSFYARSGRFLLRKGYGL